MELFISLVRDQTQATVDFKLGHKGSKQAVTRAPHGLAYALAPIDRPP